MQVTNQIAGFIQQYYLTNSQMIMTFLHGDENPRKEETKTPIVDGCS